jgi:hypothetical protein
VDASTERILLYQGGIRLLLLNGGDYTRGRGMRQEKDCPPRGRNFPNGGQVLYSAGLIQGFSQGIVRAIS